MLVDLRQYSMNSPSVVNTSTLKEIQLPSHLRQKIQNKILEGRLTVNPYTAFSRTSATNFAVMPNQIFRFACEIYDAAFAVMDYFKALDEIKQVTNLVVLFDENVETIKAKLMKLNLLNIDDAELLAQFISFPKKKGERNEFRLGGKSIFNKSENGTISVRSHEDCFGSVVLTMVNLPNSSSSIFGDLVYSLVQNKDLYDEIRDYFQNASDPSTSKKTVIPNVGLSKPFLLLAGISGTGKSRFVREQAKRSSGEDAPSNYELISVRPDWHEPSDLLGYVSRLGENAPHFVSTPTLKFMVSAWKNINPTEEELSTNRFEDKNVLPYWLCLDEMNLAPVEQYFADYLSVIETREWTDGCYRCDPILKADVIKGLSDEGRITLKKDLGLETGFDALWDYFCAQGVPIPYNLIVAGTVNMDETTHGFSRKVIDRALTVDFGEFFPNDFDAFFDGSQKQPIVLSYPTGSEAREETDAAVKSRQFLKDLNESALKGTAFEVAFRALNELLLSVQSFAPYSDNDSDNDLAKLQAVWDDFLMMKVLPRIEGDRDKVGQVLDKLKTTLESQLSDIWSDETNRPDLWRDTKDPIPCRSKVKIKWMQGRLDKSGFTSFWP